MGSDRDARVSPPGASSVHRADDLDRMTPDEDQAAFEASVVWDPESLPTAYRRRVHTRFADVIARRDRVAPDRSGETAAR